jgi:hypothetical protein
MMMSGAPACAGRAALAVEFLRNLTVSPAVQLVLRQAPSQVISVALREEHLGATRLGISVSC